MTQHAAFLRGINLGKRRVTNDELAAGVGGSGVTVVGTFLASGNVVVDVARKDQADLGNLEGRIERALEESLGFPVGTLLRSFAGLQDVVAFGQANTPEGGSWKPHVIFTRTPAGPEREEAFARLEGPDDRFHVRTHEVVWMRNGGLLDSAVDTKALEEALGDGLYSQRTLNTVARLLKKFG